MYVDIGRPQQKKLLKIGHIVINMLLFILINNSALYTHTSTHIRDRQRMSQAAYMTLTMAYAAYEMRLVHRNY